MQNPLNYIYSLYRLDYDGFGDDGFAVPVARCDDGTIFLSFSILKGLEPSLATIEKRSRTGVEPVWGLRAQGDWIQGHQPGLVCYDINVGTIPIFIDDVVSGTVENARVECHQTAVNPPAVVFDLGPLKTGQRGATRKDDPAGSHTNHGDSSLPRFGVHPDRRIGVLGLEITRLGIASNWPVTLEMLARAKTITTGIEFETLRINDEPITVQEPDPEPGPVWAPSPIPHAPLPGQPLTLEQRVFILWAERTGEPLPW